MAVAESAPPVDTRSVCVMCTTVKWHFNWHRLRASRGLSTIEEPLVRQFQEVKQRVDRKQTFLRQRFNNFYPHVPTGTLWIYRLLFVCFVCVCLFVWLRISPVKIKLTACARWFMGILGMESPILGNFAPQKPKIGRIGQRASASDNTRHMRHSWNCAACERRIGMCGYTAVPEDGRSLLVWLTVAKGSGLVLFASPCIVSLVDVFRGLSNARRQMAWNATSDCSRSRSLGLVRSQRRLCQNYLDMMPSVARASRDTVDICQELFADRRWNCSTIMLAPNFLPDLAGSKFPSLGSPVDSTNLLSWRVARSLCDSSASCRWNIVTCFLMFLFKNLCFYNYDLCNM